MNCKMRKLLCLTAACIAMFSVVGYGASVENLLVANKTEERTSAIAYKKTTRDNSALVTMYGPDSSNGVYVYVKCKTDDTMKTSTKLVYNTLNNTKFYYKDPFDSTKYINKNYVLTAKMDKYARYGTMTISGYVIP